MRVTPIKKFYARAGDSKNFLRFLYMKKEEQKGSLTDVALTNNNALSFFFVTYIVQLNFLKLIEFTQ
jgi:hypothetical protein